MLVAMLGCNVQGGAANSAVEGSQAPLHVQSKACQQQLVHDLMVAMPRRKVARGHALSVVARDVASRYD